MRTERRRSRSRHESRLPGRARHRHHGQPDPPWKRGEITPVSSASSGLKDYVFNHVWTVFEQLPFASRVLLVRGEYTQSVPFLLIADEAGRWFDVLAREVVVS